MTTPEPDNSRTIARRTLPGARAAVGGLMVATAVLLTLVGSGRDSSPDLDPWVVAARDLPPGHRLSAADLAIGHADLDAAIAHGAFRQPGSLTGAVTLGPVSRGALLQAGGLTRQGSSTRTRQVSFPVPAAAALAGALVAGERVDVVAEDPASPQRSARFVIQRALVVAVSSPDGVDDRIVITVALDEPDDVLALSEASLAGDVVVVRSPSAGNGR